MAQPPPAPPPTADSPPATDAILEQVGTFFRRTQTLFQLIRPKDDGLERAAYILLGIIYNSGPSRLTTLASTSYLNLSTVSRQVAALESAGMVVREPDPEDGRASIVRCSDKGREVLEHNRQRWREEFTTMLADWKPEEREEFARLFTRLNDAIATHCAPEDKQ